MLYPLFFKPISKERLWGGRKLMDFLNKPFHGDQIGESWELSAVSGYESVVLDGPLQGKSLNELIEIYKADLVGKSVYERFGNDFPILIKYIDAQKDLSVQLHPMIIWQKSVITPLAKMKCGTLWMLTQSSTHCGFFQRHRSKRISTVSSKRSD